ncbi:MAG: type IV secretion system protein [Rickettsiales bacterium]|jgi:type IV secretion system protein VirB8|nr:type IV secretion system protein [Rickettsiales bacterium]
MAKKPIKLQLKSWYSSKYQFVAMQRNILFFLSFFSIVAVLVAVIFVKQIMGSKSLVPFIIELEEKSGIPTVVEQLNKTHFTADLTLKRYFLYNYVKAVEGYNPGTFNDDYRRIRLLSSGGVWRQVSSKINPRNERSPALMIGNKGMIEFGLKSMSFVTPNRATIRFKTKNVGQVEGFPDNQNMILDVDFIFADLPLTLEDRYINPLGFQVIRYVVDHELIQGYEE